MIRMYRFNELMDRLTSPFWGVSRVGKQYFFVPVDYL